MAGITLGLDIGSNSIGWALLNTDGKPTIVDAGVRVFPEKGIAGKVSKGGKQVKVSQRAMKGYTKRARRNRARYIQRKNKLISILSTHGLLPTDEKDRDLLLRDLDVPKKERTLRPYRLRAKGLNERLTLHEFGRVLYHLNQRRGYFSNRKTGDPSEDKQVGKSASILEEQIVDAKCRSLGEYLFENISKFEKDEDAKAIQRIRQRYIFRSTYLKEFSLLWEKQKEFHPDVLSDNLKTQIQDNTIFYQRTPISPKPKRCEYEPQSYTCKKANWHARWYVLYQTVNNIKVESFGNGPILTTEQREIALNCLANNERITFKQLKKALGFDQTVEFNFEESGKVKSIKGDRFLSEIRQLFGSDRWDTLSEDEKRKTTNMFAYFDDGSLSTILKSKWNFDNSKIKKALSISIPEGRMPYSMIAIKKLNCFFKSEGCLQYEALARAYPDGIFQRLPVCGFVRSVPEIENHVVLKSLHELKKVVNAVIDEYGKPDKIHVEMARDISKSPEERDNITRRIRELEGENEKYWKELKALISENQLDVKPDKKSLLKYKLWKEAEKRCVFCGIYVHPKRLFEADIQIEHILPRSRSFDNSFLNKTIAHSHCNQIKDRYTPFEAYNNDPERYQHLKKCVIESSMPKQKKQRFFQEILDDQKALDRNLNDTRYANKVALKMLKQIGCPVIGRKAILTSTIRELLSFNKLLNPYANVKNRLDNRHHVIDAIIVALMDDALVTKLKQHFENPFAHEFVLPDGLWEMAMQKIEKINISHRPSYTAGHHISDKLHLDNPFGLTEEAKQYFSEGKMLRLSENVWICKEKLPYIKKKKLTEVIKTIEDIENSIPETCKHIKDAIYKEAKRHNINIKDAKAKIPENVLTNIYLHDKNNKKIPVKRMRSIVRESSMIVFTDKDGRPYKAYPTGRNHHMEIVELNDGTRKGVIVTKFEALRRQAEKKPIIQKKHEEADFKFSLAQDDLLMVTIDGNQILHRVEKISIPDNIILRPHVYGGPCKDTDQKPLVFRVNPRTLQGHKVTVDPIGRIFPAKD